MLAWKALCAALLPIRLADLPEAIPRFLAHLGAPKKRRRKRAMERFCEIIGTRIV